MAYDWYVQVMCFSGIIVCVRIVIHVLLCRKSMILTMLRAEYLRIIRSYAMQRLRIVNLNVEVESDDPRMT